MPGIDASRLLVSDHGRVRMCFGNRRELSDPYVPHKMEVGYTRISVDRKAYFVHRLVAKAFLPPQPSPEHTIDHKNRNRSDNRVDNLRWASRSMQNMNQIVADAHTTSLLQPSDNPWEDLKDEVWVEVGRLRISNMGRVQTRTPRGVHWEKKHHPKPDSSGYPQVLGRHVHLHVAEAFIGPKPSASHTVDHLNGDKTDNRACNLRWATKLEQRMNQKAYAIRGVQRQRLLGRPCLGTKWRSFESIAQAVQQLTAETSRTFRKGSISEVLSKKLKSHCGWTFKRCA